jgi:hypothetical protein
MRTLVAALAIALAASCANPVHSDAVDAQGGDSTGDFDGISPGPTHRAGQQCLACHGGDGPGPDFAFAGTIYATRNDTSRVAVGAVVSITDNAGTKHDLVANEVGNFYITKDDWAPSWPANVTVKWTDPTTNAVGLNLMLSHIGGDGGCGFCHYGADGSQFHMPPVYVNDAP